MNKQFQIKKEHLKLAKRMCVDWSAVEFGAPEINPKRPYGNSSVIQDIVEILGIEEIDPGIFSFKLFDKEYLFKGEDKHNIDFEDREELVEILNKLHKEMQIALQIFLITGTFEEGTYEKESQYDDLSWKKIIN